MMKLKKPIAKELEGLIMATTHKEEPKINLPSTELEKIICDLDLREFASDRQKFNAPELRQEFALLSDDEWNKGRTEFIEYMLNKKFIYYTDTYRNTLESQARHNLTVEMETINQ